MAEIPALEDSSLPEDVQTVGDGVSKMTTEEIILRAEILDGEIEQMRRELADVANELQLQEQKIKELLRSSIEGNTQLPFLVARVVELLDVDPGERCESEDGGSVDLDQQRKDKWVIINTSTHLTLFLPFVKCLDAEKLRIGDLVVVERDSYLVLETLPQMYDPRVKAMEVDVRPTEQFSDIGGLDEQIEELYKAIILPLTHKGNFTNSGKTPSKGVLLFGPPGTGKTLLARACAAQTNSTFLKLTCPQLVQASIGEGAKLVREAFALAKEKAPAIIFIDQLHVIGAKRSYSWTNGDREVQRTMLELSSQLDGMNLSEDIKMIAATDRVDILDPGLLRSGHLDRKIEIPLPDDEARARIMRIHSRQMNYERDVNFEDLARCTDGFSGAECKAVCVEAGVIALGRGGDWITREDYMIAIMDVHSRKERNLDYYV